MSWDISTIPWQLGQTASAGLDTVDPKTGANLEGMEYIVRDNNVPGKLDIGTGFIMRLRLVRNKSGIALLPRRLVVPDPANNEKYILGYPTADAERAYPVDPWLPAVGVQPNDLFYIITGGPAQCLLPAASPPTLAVGSEVVAALAAARTTATGGRLKLADYTAGATLPANVRNAMTALTAGSTANMIVNVRVPWDNRT